MDIDFGLIDNGLDYYESQYIYKNNVGDVFKNYNNLYTDLSNKSGLSMRKRLQFSVL